MTDLIMGKFSRTKVHSKYVDMVDRIGCSEIIYIDILSFFSGILVCPFLNLPICSQLNLLSLKFNRIEFFIN